MPASISDKVCICTITSCASVLCAERLPFQFSLNPDPSSWGADLSLDVREPDDDLHAPDPRRDHRVDKGGHIFTARGLANLGCLLILAVGMVTLLYAIICLFRALVN